MEAGRRDTMTVDAVVLCGGGPEPGLAPGLPNKGFIEIAGRPLVAHVLAALGAAPSVGRIAVVGPPDPLRAVAPADTTIVANAGGLMDNVVRATSALGARGPVLATAADLPLLTAEAVEEFVSACAKHSADFCYPLVPRAAMEARFPGAAKTYVTVVEGTFTGGSVLLFNPRVIDRVRPFVERLIADRKKPWRLAQLFGWSIVMKLASGRLTIPEVVAKAVDLTGIAVAPVIVPRPELALDVDVGRPENLELIRQALESC